MTSEPLHIDLASGTATLTIRDAWSKRELEDLLTTAVESGIQYWCRLLSVDRAEDLTITRVEIVETEGDSAVQHTVTWVDMAAGVEAILSGRVPVRPDLAAQLRGEDRNAADADISDCVLQAGIFGEVIYG